jgi:hypothetical protein
VVADRFNVRFGSKADIPQRNRDVCFTPKSGHQPSAAERPLCAKSGLVHRSKISTIQTPRRRDLTAAQ